MGSAASAAGMSVALDVASVDDIKGAIAGISPEMKAKVANALAACGNGEASETTEKAADQVPRSAGEGVLHKNDLVVTSAGNMGNDFTITHRPTGTKLELKSCYGYDSEVYHSVEVCEVDGDVMVKSVRVDRVDHEGNTETVHGTMKLELKDSTTLAWA
mmetsp:Transcript_71008/g.141042  ORF Transcript_71008/g.141042 Transcript_71008/m.141042 type:complete len:159 (+) Transcript_71008:114-590(+)